MSKTIMITDNLYKQLSELLLEVREVTGESTLQRPGMIEKMVKVYKEHLGIK